MTEPRYIQFPTVDGLSLPGLLFAPARTTKAAIYLHGNGGSSAFYMHDFTLAEEFNKNNIAFLHFNNRGAELIKRLTVEKENEEESKYFGAAYEKIKDCVEDIDGAVSLLEQKGYKEIYLIGNSTGANKICVYNYYKPKNKIAKYILIAGGDDTGHHYESLGKDKFCQLLKKAKEKIDERARGEIICDLLPGEIISWQSFLDIADPDGDYNVFPFYEVINNEKLSTYPLFRYFKSIQKPSLVIYGELDEYTWGDTKRVIEILKKYQPEFVYQIIPGADHRFQNKKKEVADVVINWLKK
jgi:pimeloyl-ACP methyl ester carboxylesterase